MISVLSCHALGNGDVCHGPSAGTHEDEKPILLVLCTQYHANTVSWPDLFFHLAKYQYIFILITGSKQSQAQKPPVNQTEPELNLNNSGKNR